MDYCKAKLTIGPREYFCLSETPPDGAHIHQFGMFEEDRQLIEDLASRSAECDEAIRVAEEAIRIGKHQAAEWDRFWAAMGVASVDITVDQAIEKYKSERAECERLRAALKDIRTEIASMDRGTTHFEGCEEVHPRCRWVKKIDAALLRQE